MKKFKFKVGDLIKTKYGDRYRFIIEVGKGNNDIVEDFYRFYDMEDPEIVYRHWKDYVEERYVKVN